MIFLYIACFWIISLSVLYFLKRDLFRQTWHEPYFSCPVLVIESDDWGPGGSEYEEGLRCVIEVLRKHKDRKGHSAVLTANVVLSAPDPEIIEKNGYTQYIPCFLKDHYQSIYELLRYGQDEGLILPQLHGLSHAYTPGLLRLAREGDTIVCSWLENFPGEWEKLPDPLQAYYVDGTRLPSNSLSFEEQIGMIQDAMLVFRNHFGVDSQSTVAPCYLWDENTEKAWQAAGIQFIQTAGYRCTMLNAKGGYQQDLSTIRMGDKNILEQIYLVRTVMYEPRDRSDAEEICWKGIRKSFCQGLPAVICTHRHNFAVCDGISNKALAGLDRLLSKTLNKYPDVNFLNSIELGITVRDMQRDPTYSRSCSQILRCKFFLCRLWVRHRKLRCFSIATLIVIPAFIFILIASLIFHQRKKV